MGNNASKQGEKEKEGGAPTSPAVRHSSSSSTTNSTHRKDPRTGSIRRHHPSTDTSASASPSDSHRPGHSFSTTATSQHTSLDDRMGQQLSKAKGEDKEKTPKAKATPVKVPRGSDPKRQRGPDSQFEPSGPPRDPNFIPHSNLNFPPRLPLPIEEELHTPGSPILTGHGGLTSALHQDDVDGPLPRQSSAISNTTIEDDELGNELLQDQHERVEGYVPTTVYWRQGGEKVYVTGTFAQWSTKIRMHKDMDLRMHLEDGDTIKFEHVSTVEYDEHGESNIVLRSKTDTAVLHSPSTGYHSALLQLRPGTHHIKFIIDGEMQLSNDLETAADFTNILVNYIEVSADDIPKDDQHKAEGHGEVPEGVYPPQVLPSGTEAKDHAPDSVGKTQPGEPEIKSDPVFWGKELPPYLHDIEKPEQTNRYQRSAKAVNEFTTPPGLPLFLGKSILNGTTPMKDDASVLNMPNHTVLNHLATSSIKNEVLATSITTRYIRKYVTTIVYKPTENGD